MRKRSLIIILATVLAVAIAFFLSGTIFAPEHTGPDEGSEVSLRGQVVCLPHHNTDGPQTMECAIGFRDEDDNYYALRDTTPERTFTVGVEFNVDTTIGGIFHAETSERYQQIGVIEIKGVAQ